MVRDKHKLVTPIGGNPRETAETVFYSLYNVLKAQVRSELETSDEFIRKIDLERIIEERLAINKSLSDLESEPNRPILILTGGKTPPERSVKRAQKYIKFQGENEVLIVYDETWHADEASYRFLRVTRDDYKQITRNKLVESDHLPLNLKQIIRFLNPRLIEIQSNNYGSIEADMIIASGVPTTYFLDYAAKDLRGYREGEAAGIRAADKIRVRMRKLVQHLAENYTDVIKDKKVILPGK